MICPTCKSQMITVEHKKIELDYCPECHGVWFDSGELELLLESLNLENREQFVDNMLNAPEAKTSEKKRKCPICSKRMRKAIAGEKPGILIDVCRNSHGLWFDGNEVGQLIKQLSGEPLEKPGSHHHVQAFLKEVFQDWDQTGSEQK